MPKKFKSHRGRKCEAGRQAPELNTRNTDALNKARRLRSSARWQKHRVATLSRFPLCFDPYGDHDGQPAEASDVHHIQPVHSHPQLLTSRTNTVPLCKACHAQIEGEERRGRTTVALFKTWPSLAWGGGLNL